MTEETKKKILQAIEKKIRCKGDWWKFKHRFEQLGCGCDKILCGIFWLDTIRNTKNRQKNLNIDGIA